MRYISDRIAVLYLGRLMELGPAEVVFDGPHHPYTEALLSAVPTVDGGGRERIRLEGDIPSAADAAVGLRLPHALPAQARRDLRGDRAAAARGRGRPPDAVPHPARGAAARMQADEDPRRSPRAHGRSRSRCDELELAPPGPGEVLVRLHASGVCHSDLNAIDGTAETRCPAVLGHEGAGVVEAIGAGVRRVAVGDHVALSWAPSCGECAECLRDLPQLCSTAWPAMGTGGLMDGTTRLSRDGEPVYHYSFLSTFAEACVVPERSCVPIPREVPFEIAGLVGCAVTTGVGAVWRTAGVRPGDRVAVIGCGGVGLSAVMAAVAVGAEPVVAVDVAASKLDVAAASSARPAACSGRGRPEATAEAVREASGGGVDYAIEATGRPEAMLAAFLSTRARGAAVLIGSRARTPSCRCRRSRSRAWSGACSARSTARRGPSATSRRRSSSTSPGGFRSTGSSRTGCRSTRSGARSS